jgi:hypothetical protein
VVAGLEVGGAPVGRDGFLSTIVKKNVHKDVGGTFEAIAELRPCAPSTSGNLFSLHCDCVPIQFPTPTRFPVLRSPRS